MNRSITHIDSLEIEEKHQFNYYTMNWKYNIDIKIMSILYSNLPSSSTDILVIISFQIYSDFITKMSIKMAM